ncbi:hypothetical protein FACS189490_12060 [Clostridia bacterium]|nr:hypothetical protein FACS189490_12060 [Clostridia bacterium]
MKTYFEKVQSVIPATESNDLTRKIDVEGLLDGVAGTLPILPVTTVFFEGDGTTTEFPLVHNLGLCNPSAFDAKAYFRTQGEPWSVAVVKIEPIDENTIEVIFGDVFVPPTGYEFKIVFQSKEVVAVDGVIPEEPADIFQMIVNSGYDGTFILPLGYTSVGGACDLSIDWGDETEEVLTQLPDSGVGVPHTFPEVNTYYTIGISGDVTASVFDGDFYSTVSMLNFGSEGSGYAYASEANRAKLTGINGSLQNIRNTQDTDQFQSSEFNNMFAACVNLKYYSRTIDDLMTQYPDNGAFSGMFYGCYNITAPRTYANIPQVWGGLA